MQPLIVVIYIDHVENFRSKVILYELGKYGKIPRSL